jgi:Glycosyltransferase family 87
VRRVCRLLIFAIALLAAAPNAHAAGAGGAGPDQLTKPSQQPDQQAQIAAIGRDATAIADRTVAARRLRARGEAKPYPQPLGGTKWRVVYLENDVRTLEVDVDIAGRGSIDAVWEGAKANFPMARGYPGWFGAHVTAPWVWLPLCALFLFLFVDLRHVRRLVHLDLVAILGFGVSQWFFQRGDIGLSVPLAYLPLVYLLVRMVFLARSPPPDRLAPVVGPRVLAVVLVLACAFRIALNVFDTNDHFYVGWGKLGSTVVDVGYAGVLGADRIQHGLELYTPEAHLDTYGPLNYAAYVPFERIWPYHGVWDDLPAAHAAAITFDLLTIFGLFALGLRLAPGRDGRTLGLALACAWAVCPYTAYVLNASTNDALISASVVWALVAFRSSLLSGLLVGLGAAAKFVPAALLPGLVRLRRRHGLRDALVLGAAFAATVLAAVFAFAPPEGVDLVWRHTVARQAGSESPFSVWGMWDWIGWLRTPLEALAFVGAVAASFGRDRAVAQAAAIGGALILAVEITAYHWIYFYIVWFLPLVLIAVFAPSGRLHEGRAGSLVDSPE